MRTAVLNSARLRFDLGAAFFALEAAAGALDRSPDGEGLPLANLAMFKAPFTEQIDKETLLTARDLSNMTMEMQKQGVLQERLQQLERDPEMVVGQVALLSLTRGFIRPRRKTSQSTLLQ